MRKINSNSKKVMFRKISLFKKEIEVFNGGLLIDYNLIATAEDVLKNPEIKESEILTITGIDHVYRHDSNTYDVRYNFVCNDKTYSFIEQNKESLIAI